jgi:GH3 auxin-responsive promoter
MNFKAAIANSLWLASSLPALMRFQRALNHPAGMQMQLLRGYLAQNAETDFGKAHGFGDIKDYEEFARRVPLTDYDDLEPWIERIMRGEKQVLTHETVTHLIPTSGSSGARKLIPFTAGLQREFNRAIGPWVADIYRQHPSVALGTAYWSISPAIQIQVAEPSVVPIGFEDDSSYLGGARKQLVDAGMAVPSELRLVADMEQFRYLTLLCLLRQGDLRLISIWHPSFFSLLLDMLPTCWENLLADIESGRCRYSNSLTLPILRALRLRPMQRRAIQLRSANPSKPETIWSFLKIISCWGDGIAEFAIADLQRRFPNTLIQRKGLIATEALVTIPFSHARPLAICSHFFEFIDGREKIHLAHELRENETYEIVVTTGGGLWRYRLQDEVQVTGFVGQTPSLRFLSRKGIVSDLFGEKLTEAFVAHSIQKAVSDLSLTLRFALLAPDEDGPNRRYTLYAEGEIQPELAILLDVLLAKNPHYAWCRQLGQLQPLRLFHIKTGGREIFFTHETLRKKRLGEIKPLVLSLQTGWTQVFEGDYLHNFSNAPLLVE